MTTQQAEQDPAAGLITTPETTTDKYLRQIRNIVVAAFVIWLVAGLAGGITWIAVSAHDHAVAQNAACAANGGFMISGQCD